MNFDKDFIEKVLADPNAGSDTLKQILDLVRERESYLEKTLAQLTQVENQLDSGD